MSRAHVIEPTASAQVPVSEPALGRPWRCLRLWLRIHWDGFRYDPLGYLQGLFWLLRRLRVRARHRLSALVGRSPSAYAFWVSCREPRLLYCAQQQAGTSTVLPVIDCRRTDEGLERTIQSLWGATALLLGGPAREGHVNVASAAELAAQLQGDSWICPIDCGDQLAPSALAIYSAAISDNPGARIIYSDDDLVDGQGKRSAPHFKPRWNPELFEHHDFVTGACVLKADAARLHATEGDGWPSKLVGDLLDEALPVHLPLVLHHRRTRPEPIIPVKRLRAARVSCPTVSVIVPTKNQRDLLETCVAGVRSANYPSIELIIVDNGSDDLATIRLLQSEAAAGAEVLCLPGPFNYSALNNRAVKRATGSLLCFLNNDVEMIDTDWLPLLVEQALREDVGAVGAKLLYADGTIQHAGVYTGIGGGAGHGHRFVPADEEGYFHRHQLPQQVSAVTGACLVVARDKFVEVGGFDEESFPVAFNDIDLCLKLNERGWRTIYEPRATLIHHESRSRGSDRARANRERFAGELAALKRKWRTDVERDPFHHPHLSPFTEQFLIAV